MPNSNSVNDTFEGISQLWDLDTLYNDLASAKGKHLTPVEKLHLRGLLSGYSPSEIAEKLGKTLRGVETDLCSTIYKYVKYLINKTDEKLDNWRNISQWLEDSGYKYDYPQVSVSSLLTEKSIVNITNVNIERDQVVFQFNLKIPTSDISDLSSDISGSNEHNNSN